MAKVEKLLRLNGEHKGEYIHFCPACNGHHSFDARWTFNGDFDNPTFSPSMRVTYPNSPTEPQRVCHYYVRNGFIEYEGDCTHKYKGQVLRLPEINQP